MSSEENQQIIENETNTEEREMNEIEIEIQTAINSFNEWNAIEQKDMNKVDEFVKILKELIIKIKSIQAETGACPTSSDYLTNLLTISLVLNSYKSNTNFDE